MTPPQLFTWLCCATAIMLAAPPSSAQECNPLASPALNNTDLQPLQGCTVLRGSLILGYADCSQACTVTDLGPLSSLRTVQGSFIIQCCNAMSEIAGLPSLGQIEGTLMVRSNMRLQRISAQSQFSSIGSIDISQNQNLQAVTSFTTVNILSGYLVISRNPLLTDISGFRNLVRISGGDGSGQALSILYNIALTDLSGLRALRAIGFGAVRIEGNIQLCYAGHPVWQYGSYPLRPSQGDQGIDWRTVLSSAPIWEYTWNVSGIPTLLIQNNGNSELCQMAQCQSSCPRGIGCWGSANGLCGPGNCFVQGNTNSCVTVTVTPPPPTDCTVSWWPPTQQPFSTIFGIFFTLIALIILAIIVAVFILVVKYRGRCSDGRKGSFDVHLQNESQFELVTNEKQYSSPAHKSERSSIIASPAHKAERSSMIVSSTTSSNGGTPQKKPHPKSEAVVVLRKETRSDSLVIENLAETVEAEVNDENERAREEEMEEQRKDEEEKRRKAEDEKKRREIEEKKRLEERRIEEEEEKKKQERRKQEEEERSKHERRQREEEEKRKIEEEQIMKEEEQKEDSEDDDEETDQGAPLWDAIVTLAIPATQVELLNVIGKGTIGNAAIDVYKAKSKSLASDTKDNQVIVKQLQEDAAIEDQEVFLQPAEAMGKLKHENVLSLLGVCLESSSPLMIVLEYCSNGSLKSYLRERRAHSQQMMADGTVMGIICDMVAGLNHLNSLEIAHNDFASRNCLLTSTNTVKVGDYGFSRETFKEDYYARKEGQMAWPVRWMAPEMILDREDNVLDSMQVTLSANVWSFGIAMWEVCTFSKQPYEMMGEEEIIQELKATGKCRLKTPFSNTDQLAPLYGVMSRCWKLAQDRPTMETVLQQLQKLKEKFKSPKLKPSNTLPRQKPKRPAPVAPPGKQKKLTKTVSSEPLKSNPPEELYYYQYQKPAIVADKIHSSITEEKTDVLPAEAKEDGADRVRVNPLFVETEAATELDTAREEKPEEEAPKEKEESGNEETRPPVPAVDSDNTPPSPPAIPDSERSISPPPPPPAEDIESDDDDLSLPPPLQEDIESDKEPESPSKSPAKTSDERRETDEEDELALPPPPLLEEEEDSNDESEKIATISTPPPTEFEQDQSDFPPPPAEEENDEFLPPPMDDKIEQTEEAVEKTKKPVFDDSWKDDAEEDEENMFLDSEGIGVNTFSFTPDEDLEAGWEEFDPDQLPSFANYPNEPEGLGDDKDNPTPMLTDQEAEMIW